MTLPDAVWHEDLHRTAPAAAFLDAAADSLNNLEIDATAAGLGSAMPGLDN